MFNSMTKLKEYLEINSFMLCATVYLNTNFTKSKITELTLINGALKPKINPKQNFMNKSGKKLLRD